MPQAHNAATKHSTSTRPHIDTPQLRRINGLPTIHRAIPEQVRLRAADLHTGEGVIATANFESGDTVMIGFLIGLLTENDSHATQVTATQWARHGGLGTKVNHSCNPNCGVRLNTQHAYDFIARTPIAAGDEITFDYAMRNYTIEHFPGSCRCEEATCRHTITGWRDLSTEQKRAYRGFVAPYLIAMDRAAAKDEVREARN